MKQLSLEQRVDRLRTILGFVRSPIFSIETIPKLHLDQLSAKPGCPQDICEILSNIGAVRNWSHNNHALIDWWCPCEIAVANAEERCLLYEVRQENFSNGSDLLFFAWDCDAIVYFYNTSFSPWRIVAADGLTLSFVNHEGPTYEREKRDFMPFEPREVGLDAISILECWATQSSQA
jgi:hypothetical protein